MIDKLLFIGGYARTGTTLVQGIICSDSQAIETTKECSYLRSLVSAYQYGKHIWPIHTDDYFDTPGDYIRFNRQLLDLYFEHIQQRWGANKLIVQKEPTLALYFPELYELYPFAKFLLMTRDPRDAIASEIVRRKNAGHETPDASFYINAFIKRYQRVLELRNALKANLLFVQYESLLTQTEKTMDQIRQFTGLELPFDPTKAGWQSKRTQENSESYSPLDGKPIDASPLGKHKNVLTPGDLSIISSARKTIADSFGFDVFWES